MTNPRVKMISAVPLVPYRGLPTGNAAAPNEGKMYLVDATRIRTVLRRTVEIVPSEHAYFREGGVAVRVTGWHTFAFVHPKSVVRVRRV